ncbi:MAG: ABC transporter permease subunit [Treponema sp.]|jgi:NitT/TauT family transport system permease protein|nr:ABC transporter permease subunit [Treponema sp.]
MSEVLKTGEQRLGGQLEILPQGVPAKIQRDGGGEPAVVVNPLQPKIYFDWRVLSPLVSVGFMLLLQLNLPTYSGYRLKVLPYFTVSLYLLTAFFAVSAVVTVFNRKYRQILAYKAWFLSAAFLVVNLYNLVTIKLNLIPSIYFPAPERIIQVFITDWAFMLQCLLYSLRLLLGGFFLGAFLGVLTGTLIGWSPRWNYWVMPLIRIVGPIPSTAWIPIALVIFTRATDAALFLIALGVWFPTTILTSSGILNVRKSYFEVSGTLGAGTLRNILSIALPGAAPNIFTGLFNGTSSSFLTLMAAEMIGCKFGIGWYINWQRETLAYSQVYAALIVIAVTFSFLINIQFKIRNRALSWQKGTIRW